MPFWSESFIVTGISLIYMCIFIGALPYSYWLFQMFSLCTHLWRALCVSQHHSLALLVTSYQVYVVMYIILILWSLSQIYDVRVISSPLSVCVCYYSPTFLPKVRSHSQAHFVSDTYFVYLYLQILPLNDIQVSVLLIVSVCTWCTPAHTGTLLFISLFMYTSLTLHLCLQISLLYAQQLQYNSN